MPFQHEHEPKKSNLTQSFSDLTKRFRKKNSQPNIIFTTKQKNTNAPARVSDPTDSFVLCLLAVSRISLLAVRAVDTPHSKKQRLLQENSSLLVHTTHWQAKYDEH